MIPLEQSLLAHEILPDWINPIQQNSPRSRLQQKAQWTQGDLAPKKNRTYFFSFRLWKETCSCARGHRFASLRNFASNRAPLQLTGVRR